MGLEIITLSIAEFLAKYGYYGLFAGTFLSALFLPMGSDILFVGMLAAKVNPWICLAVATTGNWLGGLVIYFIGYSGNKQKIQHRFKLKDGQLEKQKKKIDKYGSLLALLVWIPVIGDISNIALGFYRIKPKTSLFLMFIGRMFRFLIWVIFYILYSTRLVSFVDSL